jgi:hypothetical protein
MSFSEIMGSLGVAILLLAFVLNMLKIIKTESLSYLLLNFIGAVSPVLPVTDSYFPL